jgi:Holliday junction resolvase RusA-like endonuclease
MVYRFKLDLEPVAWARTLKRGRRHFTPAAQAGRVETARLLITSDRIKHREKYPPAPLSGPVQLYVLAILTRPTVHRTVRRQGKAPEIVDTGKPTAAGREPWPVLKPDWDNLGKLVSDMLARSRRAGDFWEPVIEDDRFIVDGRTVKAWAPVGVTGEVRIELRNGRDLELNPDLVGEWVKRAGPHE